MSKTLPILLALEVEEGDLNQGLQQSVNAGERHRNEFPLKSPERIEALLKPPN